MNGFNEHIDELISKKLTGEATAGELLLLEKWMNESEMNRKEADDLARIFESVQLSAGELNFDTDIAWTKVKQQIHSPGVIKLHPPRSRNSLWLGIAASLVVLIGLLFALPLLLNKPVESVLYSATTNVVTDTLPDGSVAILNRNTSLQYEFDRRKGIRKALLKGEAYFAVEHIDQQVFLIDADGVFIEDVGTAFNVKAPVGGDTVEVFVEEGIVNFYSDHQNGVRLIAGESGLFIRSSSAFIKAGRADQNVLSYKNRTFDFSDVELRKVVRKINEVYDVQLKLSGKYLENCRLTVRFENEKIENIADVIAATLGLQVKQSGDTIFLVGDSCK